MGLFNIFLGSCGGRPGGVFGSTSTPYIEMTFFVSRNACLIGSARLIVSCNALRVGCNI
jgi:hypothetical protein